jgi:hypothetical protein
MLNSALIGLWLIAAVQPGGQPARDAAATPAAANAATDSGEALAKYNELKAKTPQTAAAQWKLANWCELNHLEPEAFVHYTAVVMLDPSRDAAWRKLGFKRHRGRWKTDEQIADEAEQSKADKEWGLRLKKIHHDVHGGRKQLEALDAVAAITETRAVPAVFREFGAGGTRDQEIAIQVLGQIDAPLATKLLAVLAVYGKTPDVRRRATETLRGRRSDDYLPILVNLLSDPLEYEVRPVRGPGSPGILYVQGQRFNVRRFYDAPTPSLRFQSGDSVSFDENGLPVVYRPFARVDSKIISKTGTLKTGMTATVVERDAAMRFSMADMLAEAQRAAVSSQLQLQADVAEIEALNRARTSFNEHVLDVATQASGKDFGKEPKQWRDALAGKGLYQRKPENPPRKPTFDELVPLAYLPRFGELSMVNVSRIVTTPPDT